MLSADILGTRADRSPSSKEIGGLKQKHEDLKCEGLVSFPKPEGRFRFQNEIRRPSRARFVRSSKRKKLTCKSVQK